jgi:hypothetical protein
MAYWLTIELEHGKIAPLPAAMDTQAEGLVYGTTVPQLLKQLDRIANKLGLEKIEHFIFKDTQGFQKLLREAEAEGNAVLSSAMRAEIASLSTQTRWHEADTARKTIQRLKQVIASNPYILAGTSRSEQTIDWILWDLEAYDLILTELEQQGKKFAFVERN